MTAATKAHKTTAKKKAAPAARRTSPARTTKVAAKKPAAKKSVAKKAVTKTTAAKPPAAKKVVAKKAPAAKKVVAKTVTVPRQRAKSVAVVATVAPVVVPPPARRTPRPLVAKARRRADGRALSYSERLEEAMHRQLKHSGPVCHQCRINAARLAALVPTGGRIAV